MNATLEKFPQLDRQALEERFLEMLPGIRAVARFAFRRQHPSRREELIAEVIANAFVAFHRLACRGRIDRAFPSVLGGFAVKQVVDGRRTGNQLKSQDLLSPRAQRRWGFSVEPLREKVGHGDMDELILEDRRSSPADIAIFRLDFESWLGRLRRFKRQLALRLAAGESPSEAARHFSLSRARVSQLRSELRADWDAFQGLPAAA